MPYFTGDHIPSYAQSVLCPPLLGSLIDESGPVNAPSEVFGLEVAESVNLALGRVTTIDALVIQNWLSTQMSPDIAARFHIHDPVGAVVDTTLKVYDQYDHVIHPVPVRVRIVGAYGSSLFLLSWKSIAQEFAMAIGLRQGKQYLDLAAKSHRKCTHLVRLGNSLLSPRP